MLSDVKARKAAAREKDYKLADSLGLFLLVRPNGSKLWRMKYRHLGKEKLLSFGSYPEVTLAQARERRDAARAQIRNGLDPSFEKKRAAASARSSAGHDFETVAREWHELQKGRWAPVHSYDVLHSLERDVFPALGAVPIAAIDAPMILDVLRKVERRGAIETAKRLRQRVSGVFVYAISRGIAREDPAAIITKARLGDDRRRVLARDTPADRIDEYPRYPLTQALGRLDRASPLYLSQHVKDHGRINGSDRDCAKRRKHVALKTVQNVVGVDRRPSAFLQLVPFARHRLEVMARARARRSRRPFFLKGRIEPVTYLRAGRVPPLTSLGKRHFGVRSEG